MLVDQILFQCLAVWQLGTENAEHEYDGPSSEARNCRTKMQNMKLLRILVFVTVELYMLSPRCASDSIVML